MSGGHLHCLQPGRSSPERSLKRWNTGVGVSTSIQTERLNLVSWREDHRGPFAGMHAERAVTLDLGGPMSRVENDAKLSQNGCPQSRDERRSRPVHP